jgi:3-hydroxyacyl-CoA dehydrogenase/enoyl-CoA hydratase/3-hydroxybutyryl-CoA epimerase
MNTDTRPWQLEIDADDIAWLCCDVPGSSANVLSAAVLEDLDERLAELQQRGPRGLVILSGKPGGFIAGADVREFTRLASHEEALQAIRRGQSVFDHLAALPFPTLALIHGYCLGGGLELALACRYRVARDDTGTRLGLPEVRLGIHPGFGGTVRSVALIGSLPALDLMLTGRSIDGRAARRIGLVDQAVPERHLRRAARQLILSAPPRHRPTRLQALGGQAWLRPWLARYLRRKTRAKARPEHYPAPHALIDLWQRHLDDPARMLRAEAESVADLITGDTARNLIRVFLLQDRLKGLGRAGEFPVRHVHVIGAGSMGGDIAAWCALRGCQVTLQDQTPERIAPAMQRAHALFSKKLKRPRPVQEAWDRLLPDHQGLGVARAEVIIEAVFEDAEVKRALYRDLEPRMKAGAILCTNTSSIPLEELTTALQRPERLVGLHFFNPVAQMQLVEIVRGRDTGADTARKAMAFTRRIDRLPLPVTSTPGFLVNRVLMPYLLEAVTLEAEGVPATLIDETAVKFGMPMGPITLADTVGLDICLHVARILSRHMAVEVPQRLQGLVEAGHLGRKSGQGFYRYQKGKAVRPPANPHQAAPADLEDRLLLRLLNEAMACLREGVVADADLLDAGMVYGTGFAPFRGGPMQHIRSRGAAELLARLRELQQRHGERFAPDAGWETYADPS